MLLLPVVYLVASIRSRRKEIRRSRTWDLKKNGNPYPPALQPMDATHDEVIFGRDEEIRRIVGRIRSSATSTTRRFVPLEGPSGCGKSSILRAGVLPDLRTGARRFVLSAGVFDVVGPISPGGDPMRSLLEAVTGQKASDREVADLESTAVAALDAKLRGDTPDPPSRLLDLLRRRRGRRERSVVAVDQIEELVALGPDTRRRFLALLDAALRHDQNLVVVCTLRSDMSGEFLDNVSGELFRDTEKIAAMQRSSLRQVVKGPAEATGVIIEDSLVDRMVDDADGADALPLLSFVLHGLYERSLRDGKIDASEYDAAMGEDNAIARYADEAVAACKQALDLSADDQVIGVLLEGIAIVDGRVVRRAFDAGSLDATELATARHLQHARLLTVNAGRYELTHDLLMRRWPAMTEAIERNFDTIRTRTLLDSRAAEWAREGEPANMLLSSAELVRIRGTIDGLRGPVGRFVDASVANDVTELRRRADFAAEQAVLAMDPPVHASRPDLALALARAANEELYQTLGTGFALYRCWNYGLRGLLRSRSATVTALTWSSPGGLLATFGEGPEVEIWKPDSQSGSHSLSCVSRVSAIAWSPDGLTLATAGHDGTVQLWSPEGVMRHELRNHSDQVSAIAWSPDGSLLATASVDGAVSIWSPQGVLYRELIGQSRRVSAIGWSADSSLLVTATHDGIVRCWSSDGALRRELRGHDDRVSTVSWSPDGLLLLTASDDGSTRVWSQGEDEPSVTNQPGPIAAASWSPDGTSFAVAGADAVVRIWAPDGSLIREVGAHGKRVHCLVWSPDGSRLASAGDDQVVRVSTPSGHLLSAYVGHSGSVRTLGWSPDGSQLASGGLDGVVRIWSGAADQPRMLESQSAVTSLTWSTDSACLASAGVDQLIRTWSNAGEPLHELVGCSGTVNDIEWSPTERTLASGGVDRITRLWKAGEVQSLEGHSGTIYVIAWAADGSALATAGADLEVRVWTSAGDPEAVLAGHTDRIQALAWSPDGSLIASGAHDKTCRLWSRAGAAIASLEGHTGAVNAVAWAPNDGELLATGGSDGCVFIWTRAGALVARLEGHTAPVSAVGWSRDGAQLTSVSHDHTARIWTRDGGVLAILNGHTGPVNDVAYSPSGSRLATASHDGTVMVWSDTGEALHRLVGHTDRVHVLAWSPDGRRLASGSSDTTIRLWPDPVAVAELLVGVNAVVGLPQLTADERRRALLPVREVAVSGLANISPSAGP